MSFEEYLISKKIDSSAFQKAEPSRWDEWSKLFSEVSMNSFTQQKLYLINPVRRKYPLKEVLPSEPSATEPAKPKPAKPVFKPKMN